MIFEATKLSDAKLIRPELRSDDRGFFARTMCEAEFSAHGLNANFVQQNTSRSKHTGTIRGMHFQIAPDAEDKFIRCIEGSIYDVIVDLRTKSLTFMQYAGFTLSAGNRDMLYVPKGFAHGFQTLHDDTEVTYLATASYAPASERGLRYDDPMLAIKWPATVTNITDKDRNWPLLDSRNPGFFA
jgi:dTDP-4-dehydrorhamnose 3,5-epimerase